MRGYEPFRLEGGPLGHLVRQTLGEQLVQDHAERIHVRLHANALTAHLLGCGVRRSHHPQRRARLVRVGARHTGLELLGDPEVQQLHLTRAGHQDVGRLKVPVDDRVLVCVLHGVAYVAKDAQPLGHGAAATGAVIG